MRKQCPRFIRAARVCYDMPASEAVMVATKYLSPAGAEDAVEVVTVFGVGRVGAANWGEDGEVTIEAMRSWDKPMVWETWKERREEAVKVGEIGWRVYCSGEMIIV